MRGETVGRRRLGALLLLETAALFAWILDISWSATVTETGGWSTPHSLALLACALWAVGLALVSGRHTAWAVVPPVSGALVLGAVATTSLDSPAGAYLTVPHALLTLALGLLVVATLRAQWWSARAGPGTYRLLAGGLVLLWLSTVTTDYTGWPNLWRGPQFSLICGAIFGLPLAYFARSDPGAWTATSAAAAYTALVILFGGLLYALPPAAQENAGRFVLLVVPLALLFPAAALDGLQGLPWPGQGRIADTLCAAAMGVSLVGIMGLVHWHLADVFVRPEGLGHRIAELWWPTQSPAGDWRYRYWTLAPGPRSWLAGMAGATAAASVSARLGLWVGGRHRRPATPATE